MDVEGCDLREGSKKLIRRIRKENRRNSKNKGETCWKIAKGLSVIAVYHTPAKSNQHQEKGEFLLKVLWIFAHSRSRPRSEHSLSEYQNISYILTFIHGSTTYNLCSMRHVRSLEQQIPGWPWAEPMSDHQLHLPRNTSIQLRWYTTPSPHYRPSRLQYSIHQIGLSCASFRSPSRPPR